MQAYDQDDDSLTFTVSGGEDRSKFNINPSTGALIFVNPRDFETPGDQGQDNSYKVKIKVTDSGGLFDEQHLTVTVNNVNEAPIITSSGGGDSASISTNENSLLLSYLLQQTRKMRN